MDRRTDLCLSLKLGLILRLVVVLAYVTVLDWAGIGASPTTNLGIPLAVLRDRGGRGGVMAAGCLNSELFIGGGP